MSNKIKILNEKIVSCKICNRLVNFREKIATEKRKKFLNQEYWGKPVLGFGDMNAKTLILGLAPAAHGGNRTGRVFTGDKSAEFLFKCLYKSNFSNQSTSESRYDGLILKNVYITLALKCVPPNDKPTSNELQNCFKFLNEEISYLTKIKTIVTLGKVAFDSCVKLMNLDKKKHKFSHGAIFKISEKIKLIASYHPSPRNVNTKRINEEMMLEIFRKTNKS